jgi:hypothetical protein
VGVTVDGELVGGADEIAIVVETSVDVGVVEVDGTEVVGVVVGATYAFAVPVRATTSGSFICSSEKVTDPLWGPSVVGLNRIPIVDPTPIDCDWVPSSKV